MDSLSSVNTILRLAQDFAAAVATVAKNNDRCKKLAERVQCIADLLRELHKVAAGTKMDAATERLLGRLQKTLSDSLRLVRSWKKSSCPLNFINGGRMAEKFDEVERDLGISNLILVARLEKQLHHQNEAASMETVMLRIRMRRDDSTDNIKRRISSIQGVTRVSVAASTKDKFTVTVRADAVDIPSLLNEVQEQLNCNVEVVGSAATSRHIQDHENKAKYKSAAMDERSEKWKHITSNALKKEIATQTTMVAVNQQASEPYIYRPFKVELVPTDGASSNYQVPAPHGFVPYPYGQPSSHPIYTQRQDSTAQRWGQGENATAVGNFTAAIGVPLHMVTPGVPELVPQPSYCYGYWPCACCHSTGGCCQNNATSPSAAYNYNQYSEYQDMFSDENPNAYCSIM